MTLDLPLDLSSSNVSTIPSKRWSPDHRTPTHIQLLHRPGDLLVILTIAIE